MTNVISFINFMNWGFLWSSNDRASLLSWFHDYVNAWLFGVLLFVVLVIFGLFFLRGYFKTVGLEYKSSELMCMFLPITILLFQLVPSLYLLYGGALLDVSSSLSLKVVGHQWYWHYEYSDLESLSFDSFMKLINDLGLMDSRLVSVDNRLIIPSQVNVRFCVTSADVIQSWSLPSMGVKVDAIPGILNVVSISFPLVGLFYGFCSELCGSNHSFMPITLEVSTWDSFLSWVFFSY